MRGKRRPIRAALRCRKKTLRERWLNAVTRSASSGYFLPLAVEHLESRRVLSSSPTGLSLADYARLEVIEYGPKFLSADVSGWQSAVSANLQNRTPDVIELSWNGESVTAFRGQWIVQLPGISGPEHRQIVTLQDRLSALPQHFQVMQHLGADGLFLVAGPEGTGPGEVMSLLAPLNCSLIEPNVAGQVSAIPNDPSFGFMWGLNNTGQSILGVPGVADADIDAPAAWDISTGRSSIIVGVLDSGVNYNHPDLAANIFVNPFEIAGNGLDDDANGFIDDVRGWDFHGDGPTQGVPDSDPMDQFGHGTHVAGTIGAVGNNALGVTGVAQSVKLLPLKIGGSANSVSVAAAISALNYVSMMKVRGFDIRLTNNSWGGGSFNGALLAAIAENRSRGILFVASAGNGGPDEIGDNTDVLPNYPSAYELDNVIAVAATTNQDKLGDFSNYGPNSVDLGAPGVSVFSTMLTSGPLSSPSGYGYVSGTSMASPHVAGATAVLYAANPHATYAQVRSALLGGVDPTLALQTTGQTPVASGGRLNLARSLEVLGLKVVSTIPADGGVVTTVPLEYVVNFSAAVLPSSVQPADFVLDGELPADSVEATGPTQLTFGFNVTPFTSQGLHTFSLAAASLLRLSDNNPLSAYSANFRYDVLRLAVTSTSPPVGSTINRVGSLTFDVNFNEPVRADSLQAADLVLSGIPEASVGTSITLLNGRRTARFTIDGIASEGLLNVRLPPGVITDDIQNPNLEFVGTYTVDIDAVPLATPFLPRLPLGSLIYESGDSGLIFPAGDSDRFTVSLDAGQAITIVARPPAGLPAGSLAPALEIRDPLGNLVGGASASVGGTAISQTVPVQGAGTYTIVVSGAAATLGEYSLEVFLNAAVEEERHSGPTNNSLATAEDLNPSFISLGGAAARGAVVGTADGPANADFYSFSLAAGETATLALQADGASSLSLVLRDQAGVLLATALAGNTNLDRVLANFTAQSSGTFVAQIVGPASADYSFVVTKNAEFDTEPNSAFGLAQPMLGQQIAGTQYALGSVPAAATQTLTFDELFAGLPPQTVDGLDVQGVHFSYQEFGLPSLNANYNGSAFGQTKYIDDPALMGRTLGSLILDFDRPTTELSFGLALDSTGIVPAAVFARLFDGNLNQVAGIPLSTAAAGFGVSEGRFEYDGTAIQRAVLTFNNALAPSFAIDNLSYNSPSDIDYYSLRLAAGATLQALTTLPGGGGEFVNGFDPLLRLFHPDGSLLAADDNGAADGRNALLNYTNSGAPATFRLAVSASATGQSGGEYLLRISGNAFSLPPFEVADSSLPNGSASRVAPTSFTVHFNDALLQTSVEASDLLIDGLPATGVSIVDGDTLTFSLPALTPGMHTLSIAAGALLDIQNTPLAEFSSTFEYDLVAPRVIAATPSAGVVIAPGSLEFSISFSEPMKVGNLSADDFLLGGSFQTGAYAPDSFSFNTAAAGSPAGTVLTFRYSALPEDDYSLVLFSGPTEGSRFTDRAGNPLDGDFLGVLPSGDGTAGGNFTARFSMDIVSAPLAVPFVARPPLGSLIYEALTSGVISPAADIDRLTFAVDAGQSISVVVRSLSEDLQPVVELRDGSSALIAAATAAAPGEHALLQSIALNDAGIYTIGISSISGAAGRYSVQFILNAALELETLLAGVTNDDLASAQNLDASFRTLASPQATGRRGAAIGATDGGAGYAATPLPFTFENIRLTGDVLAELTGVDDAAANVSLSFEFPFFGAAYTSLFVNSNGLITFGDGNLSFLNDTLAANPPQAAIAPLWDDYDIFNDLGSAAVMTQVVGDFPNRRLIVQWNEVTYFSSGVDNDPVTFQAVLSENGNIQFNYLDLRSSTGPANEGAFATSGIKAANPTNERFVELIDDSGPNVFVGTEKSVLLSPITAGSDFYRFTLVTGETSSLAVTGPAEGNLSLELLNADSEVLASGFGGTANLTQVINDFAAPDAGVYFVRVSGAGNQPYSLLVTKNAAIGTEENDAFATAHELGSQPIALGHIGATPSRLFAVPREAGNFIVELDPTTGQELHRFAAPEPVSAGGLQGLAFNGNLFYLDGEGSQQLWELDPNTGAVIDQTLITAGSRNYDGLAALGSKIYIYDYGNSDIHEFDPATGTLTNTLDIDGLNFPISLRGGLAGITGPNAIVGVTASTGVVVMIDPVTGILSQFTTSLLANYRGLAVVDGELYLGESGTSQINVYSRDNIYQRSISPDHPLAALGGDNDAPESDWYSFTVSSLPKSIHLQTSTPADGARDFVNLLNPRLELYSPANVLVATGTVAPDGRNEFLNYQPPVAGDYRIRVTGENNTTGEYVLTKIFNTVPSVISLSTFTAFESETNEATLNGTIADADAGDSHTVVINWGPGEESTTVFLEPGVFSFTATHIYRDDNPTSTASDKIQVGVTVTDNLGAIGVGSVEVTVTNRPPALLSISPSTIIAENSQYTLTGTFRDDGLLDTHTIVIAWGGVGPGQPDEGTTTITTLGPNPIGTSLVSLGNGDWEFFASHSYQETGAPSEAYLIRATVTDDDGGQLIDFSSVTVENAAPTITSLSSGSILENDVSALTGVFHDAGLLDAHTVIVNWGVDEGSTSISTDGPNPLGASLVSLGNGDWQFTATHRYLDDNPTGTSADLLTIGVEIEDDDGGSVTGSTTVEVVNVVPSLSGVSVASIQEFGITELRGTIVDAGTRDRYSLLINWGTLPIQIIEDLPVGPFAIPHRYLDDNLADAYAIVFAVSDDDAGSVNGAATAIVTNAAPIVINLPATAAINENDLFTLTGTFHDDGTTFDTHTIVINWGGGAAGQASEGTTTLTTAGPNPPGMSVQSLGSGDWRFTATHRYLDDNPATTNANEYSVGISIADDDGGSVTASTTLTVNNLAPTLVSASASAASINEHDLYTLTGVFRDAGTLDTHRVEIQWGAGEGSTSISTSGPIPPGASLVSLGNGDWRFTASHQYLDDNPTATPSNNYSVTFAIFDDDDGQFNGNQTVTVANLAPTLTSLVAANPVIDENGTQTVTGVFHETGTLDTHSIVIDWGTGELPTTINTAGPNPPGATLTSLGNGDWQFVATHQYLDDNPTATSADDYQITATITDDDNGSVSGNTTFRLSNLPPTLSGVTATSIVENGVTQLTGVIGDVGTLDTFTLRIDWGTDIETLSNVPAGPFSFQHQYLDDNLADSYAIGVTVTDDDGASSPVATTSTTVTNDSPSFTNLSDDATVIEGDTFTLTGVFHDSGTLDTHTIEIDWGPGEGSTTIVTSGPNPGGVLTSLGNGEWEFVATHRYADDTSVGTPSDEFRIDVSVTDDDGGTDSSSITVTVNNTPPTPVLDSISTPTREGTAINIAASATDAAGALDTVALNWRILKSGVAEPFATAGNVANFSFTPDDNGEYIVELTATDEDSGSRQLKHTLVVENVRPEAFGLVDDLLEDSSLTLELLATDIPADLPRFTYSIDTAPEHGALTGTAPNLTYTPNEHYNGSDSFVYLVNDGDDDSNAATVVLTVTAVNDPPSFQKGPNQSGPSINDEAGMIRVANWATNRSTGPADESGDALTFVVTVPAAQQAFFAVLPAVNPLTGELSFQPKPNVKGIVTITVMLEDNGGGATNASAAETFTIEIGKPHPWHNAAAQFRDVDGKDGVTVFDALLVINYLNSAPPAGPSAVPASAFTEVLLPGQLPAFKYIDVAINGSNANLISTLDALLVINFLNTPNGEGETATAAATAQPSSTSALEALKALTTTAHLPAGRAAAAGDLNDLIYLLALDLAELTATRRKR